MTPHAPSPEDSARRLLAMARERPSVYLIGIAGIPGSGKSTVCEAVRMIAPSVAVVPMDGYHIPRRFLDVEGLRRRGAPHTFDVEAFRRDIESLRVAREGSFPAFDHAEGDPRTAAIDVTRSTPLVLIEGLYVLLRAWRISSLLDISVFLDCDTDKAMDRVAHRHLATGLADTLDMARSRAITNDRVNAMAILADGCRERADLVLPS